MNSSKNMIVAILLLGVSYGVYQVITSPEQKISPDTELTVSTPDMTMKSSTGNNKLAEVFPDKMTMPALPKPKSFSPPGNPPLLPPKTDDTTKKNDADPLITKNNPAKSSENANSFESFTAKTTKPDFPTATPAPPPGNLRPIEPNPNDFGTGNNPPAEKKNENGFGNLLEGNREPVLPTEPIANVFPKAEQLCNEQQFREALEILTPYYRVQDLAVEERNQLHEFLDLLAAKVIFSAEHLMVGSPYVIEDNDTLDTIAQKWKTSTNLVFNVNRDKITSPLDLVPGTELKQVSGPFVAEVDCRAKTVTLFVDDLYACRFPMVSCDPNLPTGNFKVVNKTRRDAAYGDYVVELDSNIVLVADEGKKVTNSITFQTQDAKDINEILSLASSITIR
ncbi:MAG: LysM domain-containing protein [Pirellulaceae bacterium]